MLHLLRCSYVGIRFEPCWTPLAQSQPWLIVVAITWLPPFSFLGHGLSCSTYATYLHLFKVILLLLSPGISVWLLHPQR